MKYNKELEYIKNQIKKTEISLANTKKKPNVNKTEVDNLNNKLTILHNIKEVLMAY